ncbi:MAG: methyltransferase domain-containing protein [Caulobacterales bacterium]
MRVDVLALQRFYASPKGAAAQRMIAKKLRATWPDAQGLDLLGVGFATPFLDAYRETARRAVAAMPASQGAERWPHGGAGLTALCDEGRLPFADSVFDRVIIAHALEEADNAQQLLREIWRVMAPEGRLVVIAANRWSFWAQAEDTPFGYGRPYSRRQLGALLTDALFAPIASARALYAPPFSPLLKIADALEPVGEIAWRAFGGVVLMEAVKRLYAETSRPGRKVLLAAAPARASRSGMKSHQRDDAPAS